MYSRDVSAASCLYPGAGEVGDSLARSSAGGCDDSQRSGGADYELVNRANVRAYTIDLNP